MGYEEIFSGRNLRGIAGGAIYKAVKFFDIKSKKYSLKSISKKLGVSKATIGKRKKELDKFLK